MLAWDRVKSSLFALMGAADPRAPYRGLYRGTVLSQSGNVLDVKMDDPRMPGMSALPIQVGLPGTVVSFSAGARVLVAFENGDPAKPIALLWDAGAGATVMSMTLGSPEAVEAVLIGSTLSEALNQFITTGLAGVTAMLGACSAPPLSALSPGLGTLQAAFQNLQIQFSGSNGFKSNTVKVAY